MSYYDHWEQYRNRLKSAIARMTEQELEGICIPTEFILGTPRNPKYYLSRRNHLIAFSYSVVDRMCASQMLELRIPSRFCI